MTLPEQKGMTIFMSVEKCLKLTRYLQVYDLEALFRYIISLHLHVVLAR